VSCPRFSEEGASDDDLFGCLDSGRVRGSGLTATAWLAHSSIANISLISASHPPIFGEWDLMHLFMIFLMFLRWKKIC
jgi:hypothetical protein